MLFLTGNRQESTVTNNSIGKLICSQQSTDRTQFLTAFGLLTQPVTLSACRQEFPARNPDRQEFASEFLSYSHQEIINRKTRWNPNSCHAADRKINDRTHPSILIPEKIKYII